MITDVLVIKIPHVAGSLQKILETISNKNVNIEYMYGLSVESKEAYVVLKASDCEKIEKILEEGGVKTLSCEDLKKI